VDRPIIISENAVDRIYEIPHAWRLIKTLPFVVFEEFGARINLTVLDLAAKWFATQDSLSRINQNPALAFYYSRNDSLDVDYEQVRRLNKPKEMDRSGYFLNRRDRGEEKKQKTCSSSSQSLRLKTFVRVSTNSSSRKNK